MANNVLNSGLNRVAFPKARVFIYGQEVSSDVISVHINQSSGSLERTPSTCSISLVNPLDKYILNNRDMQKIGELKHKLNGTWEEALRSTQQETITGALSAIEEGGYYAGLDTISVNREGSGDKSRWSLDIDVNGVDKSKPLGGKSLSSQMLDQLVDRFENSTPSEIYQTLSGMTDDSGNPLVLTEEDATTLSKELLSRNKEYLRNNEYSVFSFMSELDVPYGVKNSVVSKKMKNTIHVVPEDRDFQALNYVDKLIYEYPMSEGDCIFVANDPVRVAMRDPFNPKVWYWSFTGFVDTFTEDSGINGDSTLTISCTDVTKTARYATIGVGSGVTQASEIPVELLEGAQNAANLGIITDKELFSNLPVYVIIDTIFFGSVSASQLSDSATSVLVSMLKDSTKEEIDQYLISSDSKSMEEWYRSISRSSDSIELTSELSEGSGDYATVKNKVLDDLKIQRRGKLNSLGLSGVSSPRHVYFKRKGKTSGIYFYVFGDPDQADNSLGAIPIKDLREWNEVLHHRVKLSDLITMNVLSEDQTATPPALSIDQTIWKIGTNPDQYPVGGGRVFYMAPAGLTSVIGLNALDRTFGGVGSVHSTFKDRLSYIYDLADAIDWRFYATPKGDIVFEMPFYDYDPSDFWGSNEVVSKPTDANKSALADVVNSAFLGNVVNVQDALTESDWERLYSDLSLYSGAFNLSGNKPEEQDFNYASSFTITRVDQSGYSNTNTDNGVITSYRTSVNWVEGNSDVNSTAPKKIVVRDPTLFPTLGARQSEGEELWSFIDSNEEAAVFAALQLNKTNANARNLSVDTIPKFGIMVNRPLYWAHRNYYCSTVSMSHSYVWNSDVSTSVNLNNVRTWSGEIDKTKKKMVFRHFGDSDRPFNLAVLFKELNEQRKGSSSEGINTKKNYEFYFY